MLHCSDFVPHWCYHCILFVFFCSYRQILHQHRSCSKFPGLKRSLVSTIVPRTCYKQTIHTGRFTPINVSRDENINDVAISRISGHGNLGRQPSHGAAFAMRTTHLPASYIRPRHVQGKTAHSRSISQKHTLRSVFWFSAIAVGFLSRSVYLTVSEPRFIRFGSARCRRALAMIGRCSVFSVAHLRHCSRIDASDSLKRSPGRYCLGRRSACMCNDWPEEEKAHACAGNARQLPLPTAVINVPAGLEQTISFVMPLSRAALELRSVRLFFGPRAVIPMT